MDREKLKRLLRRHEGYRLYPYNDLTGLRIRDVVSGKVTIGIGHNLEDNGLPPHIVEALFDHDIDEAIKALNEHIPWWKKLDPVRREALVDMMFNMGWKPRGKGSGLSSFTRTLWYIRYGFYTLAARNIRGSRYSRQVGQRAYHIAKMIETGERNV